MGDLLGTSYLLAPLLGGAVFHGLCVRYGWLSFLARPIDRGRTLRKAPVFGANKTYRGLAALALGTGALAGLQTDVLHQVAALRSLELFDYGGMNGWFFGAGMGAASMLAELPNSFFKRRLGIPPGRSAGGMLGAFLYILDQVDLVVGVWLTVAVTAPSAITPNRILLSFAIVFVVHQATNVLGYALRMRSTPR
jgi:CDP-diglyceride synthetase